MDIGSAQGWVAIVAAFGTTGYLIDFYIGKSAQKRLKAWLETWWIRLSYVTFGNFGREEAILTRNVMDFVFSSRLLSIKRAISVLAFCCIAISMVAISNVNDPARETGLERLVSMNDIVRVTINIILMAVAPFALSISLTRLIMTITIALLGSHAVVNLSCYILLFIIQIFILAVWPSVNMIVAAGLLAACKLQFTLAADQFHRLEEYIRVMVIVFTTSFHKAMVLSLYLDIKEITRGDILMVRFGTLLAVCPGAVRLLLATVFILSFVMKPLWHMVLVTLARVIEGDSPVFTLVFSAIAALTKGSYELINVIWRTINQ